MKHTYKQARKAMNNLINYFGYKKSDFYDDGEDIICINYEDCELPTWDVYKDKMSKDDEK